MLLAAVAGCTSPSPTDGGPVALPAPSTSLDAAAASACAALLEALPDEIDPGVTRRPVEAAPDRLTAWGDPPVTLECGVALPDRPEEPVIVNDVMWSVRDIGPGFRWTTTDRAVNVAVEIPDAYDNGAELVNPLAAPIEQTLRKKP